MPDIPVNSALGYIGVFLVLFGFFLIVAGLGIFRVEKVTVKTGIKTWGFGVILTAFGLIFLLPDILGPFPQFSTPTPSVMAASSSTPTFTPIRPTDTPMEQLPTNTPSPQPATNTFFSEPTANTPALKAINTPASRPTSPSIPQPTDTPVPTNTSVPTKTATLASMPSPTPAPTAYIKGYESIQPTGKRHISLADGELIVGTADRFQEDVYATDQPPCTAFVIIGPIEMDLTLWYGGWDYWANVYDKEAAKILLDRKVSELEQHQTCPSRGINQVVIP